MYIKTLSVTELNGYLKKVMDNDFILNNIRVQGEISNLKYHNSGHIYFSLKDENSKINCIMFKSNADYLNIPLNNGRKVEAVGRISVYIKDGSYQLYVSTINDIGMGELYIKFNNLKEKLSKKGLFLEEIKKEIPKYVFKIGVITSPTGAAVKDIIQVAKRRNPGTEIIIYPALVQGNEASESIINGINTLSSMEDIDVIVVARGGGSIEELWAFNDEKLAYAIYNCRIPIISGVGHETDFTICDFA
ncbi:exodeoxyribonuclease VII large subunit, partial [Clostridium polynesiense]|uniref:exodeoxyribonuclease VII large subunit n=1 Tax=Clostridium polynesiense TaxID=1325933 RepID=UPI00058FB24E